MPRYLIVFCFLCFGLVVGCGEAQLATNEVGTDPTASDRSQSVVARAPIAQATRLPPALVSDWQRYAGATGLRAFAVSKEPGYADKFIWAWSTGHPDQQTAEKSALLACQTSVRNLGRRGQCSLYAVNDQLVGQVTGQLGTSLSKLRL